MYRVVVVANETGKVVIAHGSVEFCEATRVGLIDESKEFLSDARRTETCVTPRHVPVGA